MSSLRTPSPDAVFLFAGFPQAAETMDRAMRERLNVGPVLREWSPLNIDRASQMWTPREDTLCLKMWGEGASIAQIATAVHRSINATSRRLDDLRWELMERGR